MGLRFRKSIKVAPGVKVNLNKKSASVTFGGKGVHKTFSSTGKKTTSVGVPGTGLYYTSSSGGGSGRKKKREEIPGRSNYDENYISSYDEDFDSRYGYDQKYDYKYGDNLTADVLSDAPADGPDRKLAKFSDKALKRYMLIFRILTVISSLFAIFCTYGGSIPFGIVFFAIGFVCAMVRRQYLNEINLRFMRNSKHEYQELSPRKQKKLKKKKGPGAFVWIVAALIVIGLLGSSPDSADEPKKGTKKADVKTVVAVESLSISADTATTYDINTEIPVSFSFDPSDGKLGDVTCESTGGTFTKKEDGTFVFSASEVGSYDISVSSGELKSNVLTINVEDKAAIAAAEEAQRQAEAEAAAQAEQEQQSQAEQPIEQPVEQQPQITYVLNMSTRKFHTPGCRDVKRIAPANYGEYTGTRDDVINQGYTPCGHCNP